MEKYLAWDSLEAEEEWATEIHTYCPASAAEIYARKDTEDLYGKNVYDYECGRQVHVRCPDGSLKIYIVECRINPEFCAMELS